jgi:hypothetical protein
MLAAIFLASQWHFLANKHAVLAGCSAFWPVNCIFLHKNTRTLCTAEWPFCYWSLFCATVLVYVFLHDWSFPIENGLINTNINVIKLIYSLPKLVVTWSKILRMGMGDSSYWLNFDEGKSRTKSNTTATKSILERVKLQRLVAKCCKMKKT